MKKMRNWVLAATLICGASVLTGCKSDKDEDQGPANPPTTEKEYDQSLAAKCVNGIFVGKKTDNVISFKGIPFVGQQPVGSSLWAACAGKRPWMSAQAMQYSRHTNMARLPSRHQATLLANMARARHACI